MYIYIYTYTHIHIYIYTYICIHIYRDIVRVQYLSISLLSQAPWPQAAFDRLKMGASEVQTRRRGAAPPSALVEKVGLPVGD